MKYSVDKICERFRREENLKFIFFWGHTPKEKNSVDKSCFSQWYGCKFTVDGVEYFTAEQYMMSQKALLFNDKKIHDAIMESSHPDKYKALGRQIKNFNPEIWDTHKTDIVIKGNYAKFSQNPELKNFLLNTGNSIIVEASPQDKIWGIGLAQNSNSAYNPTEWHGENLLGFCLMEVRDMLTEEFSHD